MQPSETQTPKKMRATTVRFSNELWEMLEGEARRSGVSVAQYVREAALGRVAYSAGLRREDGPFAADEHGSPAGIAGARRGDVGAGEPVAPEAELLADQLSELAELAEAVRRQGRQAVHRADELAEDARSAGRRSADVRKRRREGQAPDSPTR